MNGQWKNGDIVRLNDGRFVKVKDDGVYCTGEDYALWSYVVQERGDKLPHRTFTRIPEVDDVLVQNGKTPPEPMRAPSAKEIIVNGLRYHAAPHDSNKRDNWKGFGGHKYTVRFHDGEVLRTDDLTWDYSFRTKSRPDTAVILDGWTATKDSPICGWLPAGEHKVFGPVAE